jgi:hypothetical protein
VVQAAIGDGLLWQWRVPFASLREQHFEPLEHRGHIGIDVDADGGQMRQAVIKLLFSKIEVGKATPGRRTFDPDRVILTPTDGGMARLLVSRRQ